MSNWPRKTCFLNFSSPKNIFKSVFFFPKNAEKKKSPGDIAAVPNWEKYTKSPDKATVPKWESFTTRMMAERAGNSICMCFRIFPQGKKMGIVYDAGKGWACRKPHFFCVLDVFFLIKNKMGFFFWKKMGFFFWMTLYWFMIRFGGGFRLFASRIREFWSLGIASNLLC